MFELLQAVGMLIQGLNVAGATVVAATAISSQESLYLHQEVALPPLGQVVQIEASRIPEGWFLLRPKTEGEKCVYSGVAMAYERTWEEKIVQLDMVEQIVPPAPGVSAGVLLLLNKKSCPDKEPVVAQWGSVNPYQTSLKHDNEVLKKTQVYVFQELKDLAPAKPAVITQAMSVLEAAAATSPAAKDFLESIKTTQKLVKSDLGAPPSEPVAQ